MIHIIKKILFASVLTYPLLFSISNKSEKAYPRFTLSPEQGFLAVIDHHIQFSKENTYFDYKDGAQDVLFPVTKLSIYIDVSKNHSFALLYQPLKLETRAVIGEDLLVDNILFSKGKKIRFLYDFPFFRFSWLYDLDKSGPNKLAIGISLQIRNATIEFENLSGDQFVSKRDVGPVPVLKFMSTHYVTENLWFGTEIDGFYAPISIINGSTNEVVGAIVDANLKAGYSINERFSPYVNIRYIGGGAVGQSDDGGYSGDGYTKNWLHFFAVQIGMNMTLF